MSVPCADCKNQMACQTADACLHHSGRIPPMQTCMSDPDALHTYFMLDGHGQRFARVEMSISDFRFDPLPSQQDDSDMAMLADTPLTKKPDTNLGSPREDDTKPLSLLRDSLRDAYDMLRAYEGNIVSYERAIAQTRESVEKKRKTIDDLESAIRKLESGR